MDYAAAADSRHMFRENQPQIYCFPSTVTILYPHSSISDLFFFTKKRKLEVWLNLRNARANRADGDPVGRLIFQQLVQNSPDIGGDRGPMGTAAWGITYHVLPFCSRG